MKYPHCAQETSKFPCSNCLTSPLTFTATPATVASPLASRQKSFSRNRPHVSASARNPTLGYPGDYITFPKPFGNYAVMGYLCEIALRKRTAPMLDDDC